MKRRLLLLFPLILTGCGSQEERQAANDAAEQASAGPLNLETGLGALSPEQLQARATEALRSVLPDPASARLSNLRNGAAGAVCGDVDAKAGGRYSGPKPFVVDPEGLALVSPTAEINFADRADIFPDLYLRWCASPEELQRLGPRLAAPAPGNEQSAEPSPPDVLAMPPAAPPPTPEPPRAAPKAAERPPRQPGDDSFMNAVLRKDEQP